MRGVYLRFFIAAEDDEGSSPHARGLLVPAQVDELLARIIPACAGFTLRPPESL